MASLSTLLSKQEAPAYRLTKEGVEIFVRGTANAAKTRINGFANDATGRHYLKVYVTQVAESGKANTEIINVLSQFFDLPKSYITQTAGFASRYKIFLLDGVAIQEVEEKLQSL